MPSPYFTIDSIMSKNNLGYLIKRCGILGAQLADRRFEAQEVSFTQWIILAQLSDRPYLSPTAISDHIGYDLGALTRIVDDLQKKNFVHRERCQDDRRAVRIMLTDDGRRIVKNARVMVLALANEIVAPFTRDATDQLISSLQSLICHMQWLLAQSPTHMESRKGKTGSDSRC